MTFESARFIKACERFGTLRARMRLDPPPATPYRCRPLRFAPIYPLGEFGVAA